MLLVAFCALFFFAGNNNLNLTNPDEVFYADTAKEMIQHQSWTTPYMFDKPQFEKPILTYWLLRLGFQVMGMSSFSARFFPSLFGLIGVLAVYFLACAGFKDNKKAFIAGLILASSGFYIAMARTVFTDMIFSVFILLSLASFYIGYVLRRKTAGILFFFAFTGLAVLTKGPLGFIIPIIVVLLFLVSGRDLRYVWCTASVAGLALCCLISVPWYVLMYRQYGDSFVREFFYNDHWRRLIEAEHRSFDRWYFYPEFMIAGMFPWSAFVIAGIILLCARLRRGVSDFDRFLMFWIVTVFVVFQVAHSKLSSYILPVFPALALVSGGFISDMWIPRRSRWLTVLSIITLISLAILPAAVVFGVFKFPLYFQPMAMVIVLLIMGGGFVAWFAGCLVKNKKTMAVYCVSMVVPAFLFVVPHMAIDPYVSSREVCSFLDQQPSAKGTILCSQAYIRGVRYYSGREVAFFDITGKPLFSPHPVEFIKTPVQLREFIKRQPVTFCVLRKKSALGIEKDLGSGFRVSIEKIIGDEYVVKITRGGISNNI